MAEFKENKKMSRYDDHSRDDVRDEIDDFLEEHTIAELLEIVADAVEHKESKQYPLQK